MATALKREKMAAMNEKVGETEATRKETDCKKYKRERERKRD